MVTAFREKALVSLAATLGMLVLPAAYLALDAFGPASRVVFRPYLPDPVYVGSVTFATVLGAALGAEVPPFLHREGRRYSVVRVAAGCVLGGGIGLASASLALIWLLPRKESFPALLSGVLLAVTALGAFGGGLMLFKSVQTAPTSYRPPWAKLAFFALLLAASIAPHLRAFPSDGSLAERDAWARERVREYPGLASIVARIPQITEDVGRVVAIAPTSKHEHMFAREMNGDDMRFALDVVGEKACGILHTDCTISGDTVLDWRSGRWTFNGKVTTIEIAPTVRGR